MEPFNPARSFDVDQRGRLRLVKVAEVSMSAEELQDTWLGFMRDVGSAAAERRALRQLPKRLGREGRKQLRARMIRNGHYKHPANLPNAARFRWLKPAHTRTYPYPHKRR